MATRKISETAKEYGRGTIGGLIFSLPLLYTMEVWWTGFIASPEKLLVFIGFTCLLLVGYNTYSGMRPDASFKDVVRESLEDIALGFLFAFLFLLLINKVNFTMSFDEIAGKVIVESMITAIGVSIGSAQLGQNSESHEEKFKKNGLLELVVLALCGGVLVSSSVAPTEEILIIAINSEAIHLLIMVAVSMIISSVTLFFSDFKGSGSIKRGAYKVIVHLVITYFCALAVSFLMLWLFDRIGGHGWTVVIAEAIVLAIPASLGASAGRLLIAK